MWYVINVNRKAAVCKPFRGLDGRGKSQLMPGPRDAKPFRGLVVWLFLTQALAWRFLYHTNVHVKALRPAAREWVGL